MQSRSLFFALVFLAILGIAVSAAWYWMQTPQFKDSFAAPQLTEEEKLQTLEGLRQSPDAPPPVAQEEKVRALEALRASNAETSADTSAGTSAESAASQEEKLKTLQSLHGAQ